MREIGVGRVSEAMRDLCIETNVCIRDDHLEALHRARKSEESEIGREVLERLLENAHVSCSERIAFCQDTGYAVFFVEPGQVAHLAGGTIEEAINEGVGRGRDEGYLRPSIVESPIERANTGDNTPAVVYYDPVLGDGMEITMLVEGAGCDNMSSLKMLTPAEGLPAANRLVLETIEKAGPNARARR